ncbi:MAG: hypothetical protein MJ185_09445 [Treponema sp.]|nr:hypothetical protein [Treponema sp.]
MLKTVLTADIGTTSLKTAVISSEGEQLAFAQCAFKNPDSRFISLEWIKALERCVSSMGDAVKQIQAVSVSGNGPTVCTEDGSTVLWNANSEAINDEIKNTTNSLFLPKIALLRKYYPDEFEKSDSILSGPEFLIWQLTGNKVTILPESRYTNAYWCEELLILNGMNPENFPPFVKIGECYGYVDPARDEIKGSLTALQGLPVYGAGPDFIAAMIGTGCTETGAVYDCAGSSEGFNLCIPLPYRDERIRLLPNVTPGLWNAAVMIPESGRLLFNYKSKLEKESGHEWTYPEVIDYSFQNTESEGHRILETLLQNSENAVSILKDVAEKCGIEFPNHMFVAGGQAKNKRWMDEKERRLGLKLEISRIPDAELLGDWKAVNEG